MEMHDMGEQMEGATIPEGGKGKKEKYYPSINLTTEQLPGLEGKGIGSKIPLHIMGKIRGIREDKDKTSYDIELRECGMMGKSKDEYMKMPDGEKDKEDEKEVMGEE